MLLTGMAGRVAEPLVGGEARVADVVVEGIDVLSESINIQIRVAAMQIIDWASLCVL